MVCYHKSTCFTTQSVWKKPGMTNDTCKPLGKLILVCPIHEEKGFQCKLLLIKHCR